MARPEKSEMIVKAENGNGDAKDVFRFTGKTVQFYGTFAATLQLEGSVNGTDYAEIGSAETGPTIVAVPETLEYLRVVTSGYGSGTPKAYFAGFDQRAT